MPGDKIAIVSVNNLWGRAHLATFKKAIEQNKKTLVKEIVVPEFDNNDIQSHLTSLKPIKPDAIIMALNYGDTVAFIQKKNALQITGKLLGDFHVADNYANGNLSKELLSDVTIFVFSDPSAHFIERYKAAYGKEPGTYANTAYDAVYVIKQAIENSGGRTDSDSIVDGLHKITSYQGASGRIDFSKNNYPANKVPLLKVFKDGQFVPAR